MTGFPGSPRLIKGSIVLLAPDSGTVQRIITLQYNPDTLTRTLQVQAFGADGGDRSQALRFNAPPVENFQLEAEIDIIDQLEFPNNNSDATKLGLFPQLAALETLVYPTSNQLQTSNGLAQRGTLEIAPVPAPLSLFVWSKSRIVPMRLTEFSITEEAFDPALNPIRANVSLGMRVLNVNDVGFDHQGGTLFMSYLRQKEQFASSIRGQLGQLGLIGLP